MEEVVAPVLHENVPLPVAVNRVLNPEQMVTSAPALTTGKGLTVIIIISEVEPQLFVTVTV